MSLRVDFNCCKCGRLTHAAIPTDAGYQPDICLDCDAKAREASIESLHVLVHNARLTYREQDTMHAAIRKLESVTKERDDLLKRVELLEFVERNAVDAREDAVREIAKERDELRAREEARVVRVADIVKKRFDCVPLPPVAILPGTFKQLQAAPGAPFQGYKIVNTGEVADLFVIAYFVGNKKQFPRPGFEPFAVSELSPNSLHEQPRQDVCGATEMLTIHIENRGDTARAASVVVFGKFIKDEKHQTLKFCAKEGE